MVDAYGAAERILIVEDSPASRRVVARCLSQYELVEAADGEAALRCLAEDIFDLVLLDIGLPGIDGYEVLQQIKQDPRTAGTMVVMLSAFGQVQSVVKGFEAHADDYIIKPFRQEELVARVTSALRLKSLQDELRRVNEDLEAEVLRRTDQLVAQQQFELIGRNSAQLAHNLNSPLSAIMGYTELALAHPPAERDEFLLKARQVTLEMQEIIARLLTTVRSRESLVGDAEPLDLNEVVQQQVEFWQVDRRFRYETRVALELDPQLPSIMGLATDVRQILTNLIDNALDALNGSPEPALRIQTSATDGEVAVAVSDTGEGIAPEHLVQIFDPWFTTKPIGEGTGLGLASCSELARSWGGRLEVESEVGVGTTFRLVLPATN